MPHLFCYGSLMFAPVWSRVVAGTYHATQARLDGFERRGITGATYPCLIPGGPQDRVSGILYFEVGAADMARLDAFEGDLYERQTVTCVDREQRSHDAQAYVLKPHFRSVATATAWDADWFAREGLSQFLAELNEME
jgi:gamma-glutamylcyclotransferase (GGCT)/AIG2-like uncharacterized protein YtfP